MKSDKLLLEGKGVTERFGALAAVDGVDFEVYDGEILGLIGPNGAGKTTLINVISGFLPITEGAVTFKGESITGWPSHRVAQLGIARTFQVPKPLPGMTVLENVMVGALFGKAGRSRDMAHVEARARETLETVGLLERADASVAKLTVAGRKRVELAKALAMDPELLLLDEVMAGLNLVEIETVMNLVRAINQQGVTVLLIEHVMKAVMGVSDRVLVLHHGKRISLGVPEKVTADPKVIEAYLGERYAAKTSKRE
jgi:branched-chain amino acid transport system ATP-binding protein